MCSDEYSNRTNVMIELGHASDNQMHVLQKSYNNRTTNISKTTFSHINTILEEIVCVTLCYFYV